MKRKILVPFLAIGLLFTGCTKEETEMMDVYNYEEPSGKGGSEDEESMPAPFVNIRDVTPVDHCDGTTSKYGVEFTVEPWTYFHYYTNSSLPTPGLNIEVKLWSSVGPTVLSKFDVYCSGETDLRTTINDFNCYAVGPMSSLSKNTTYVIRAYYGGFSSNWHSFKTPNTSPCAL